MCPVIGPDLPDPVLFLASALGDGADGQFGGVPAIGVEAVVRGGVRQKEEDLAEEIELKLISDPIADDVGAAGVAGQPEGKGFWDRTAVTPVCRRRGDSVRKHAGADPTHRVVEHGFATFDGRSGMTDVADVADPAVAIVVVAARLGPFGQSRRDRSHRRAVCVGQAAKGGEGLADVAPGRYLTALRNALGPTHGRLAPEVVGHGLVVPFKRRALQLEHEIMRVAGA